MRTLNFAKRNFKELIRDPLGLVFTIVLPLFLLYIFQQFKIPNEAFGLTNFTPGIIVFSFAFITLFTATLVARDRTTSFLIRLGVSPMKPVDYIFGYTLAIIPIIVVQDVLFFILAIILGLKFSLSIILTILASLVIAVLFIMMGLLIGSILSEKGSSGFSSVIVQFVCFTSGMYFSNDILGEGFQTICKILPFESALTILKGIMNNNLSTISARNIVVFSLYTIIITILAVITFKRKMISDNKN